MKLESKYFDMIRISRRRGGSAPRGQRSHAACEWKGCGKAGEHRAPRGRNRDGDYYLFCEDHIRAFNASYNYFDGMSDAEVEKARADMIYGNRPTWKMGDNAQPSSRTGSTRAQPAGATPNQPPRGGDSRRFHAWRAQKARAEAPETRRKLKPLERKSLETLGLSDAAGREEIKARFKELVKRHHPDTNGGDRAAEDKLREIIQAYNYLKQVAMV